MPPVDLVKLLRGDHHALILRGQQCERVREARGKLAGRDVKKALAEARRRVYFVKAEVDEEGERDTRKDLQR